jgi:hypothetical protein
MSPNHGRRHRQIQEVLRDGGGLLSLEKGFEALMITKKLRKYLEKDYPKIEGTIAEKEAIEENHYRLWGFLMTYLDARTADTIETTCTKGDGGAAYQAMIAIFERPDTLRMANLRAELARVKLHEGGNADEFLSKIASLVRRIKEGEGDPNAITDQAQVAKILSSLPKSMLPWVLQKNAEKGGVKLPDLISELRTNTAFLNELAKQEEEEEDQAAFMAWKGKKNEPKGRDSRGKDSSRKNENDKRNRGKPGIGSERRENSKGTNSRNFQCYECGKAGHLARNCFSRTKPSPPTANLVVPEKFPKRRDRNCVDQHRGGRRRRGRGGSDLRPPRFMGR